MKNELASGMVGACGEHYVAAWLTAHGFIAAIPRAGVPGCDLFVALERGGRALKIQVKTGRQASKTTREEGKIYLWSTAYGALKRKDHEYWYAFLWLNGWPAGPNHPEVFFVPAKRVISYLRGAKRIKDKWPFFWMKEREAEKFRGEVGLKLMSKTLRT